MKDELKRAVHHRGRTTEDSTKQTKTSERRAAKRGVKRDVSTQLIFTNTERSAVPARLADPYADDLAREIFTLIQDAGSEFGKTLYAGEGKPHHQNPLFEIVPQTRSIEPHKKRRAK